MMFMLLVAAIVLLVVCMTALPEARASIDDILDVLDLLEEEEAPRELLGKRNLDFPTSSPTGAPTSSPTAAPSASPTLSPTLSPTAAPTNKGVDPGEGPPLVPCGNDAKDDDGDGPDGLRRCVDEALVIITANTTSCTLAGRSAATYLFGLNAALNATIVTYAAGMDDIEADFVKGEVLDFVCDQNLDYSNGQTHVITYYVVFESIYQGQIDGFVQLVQAPQFGALVNGVFTSVTTPMTLSNIAIRDVTRVVSVLHAIVEENEREQLDNNDPDDVPFYYDAANPFVLQHDGEPVTVRGYNGYNLLWRPFHVNRTANTQVKFVVELPVQNASLPFAVSDVNNYFMSDFALSLNFTEAPAKPVQGVDPVGTTVNTTVEFIRSVSSSAVIEGLPAAKRIDFARFVNFTEKIKYSQKAFLDAVGEDTTNVNDLLIRFTAALEAADAPTKINLADGPVSSSLVSDVIAAARASNSPAVIKLELELDGVEPLVISGNLTIDVGVSTILELINVPDEGVKIEGAVSLNPDVTLAFSSSSSSAMRRRKRDLAEQGESVLRWTKANYATLAGEYYDEKEQEQEQEQQRKRQGSSCDEKSNRYPIKMAVSGNAAIGGAKLDIGAQDAAGSKAVCNAPESLGLFRLTSESLVSGQFSTPIVVTPVPIISSEDPCVRYRDVSQEACTTGDTKCTTVLMRAETFSEEICADETLAMCAQCEPFLMGSPSGSSSGGGGNGALIGGVVGAVAAVGLLAAVGVGGFFLMKKRGENGGSSGGGGGGGALDSSSSSEEEGEGDVALKKIEEGGDDNDDDDDDDDDKDDDKSSKKEKDGSDSDSD